jgi:hypothetical protein
MRRLRTLWWIAPVALVAVLGALALVGAMAPRPDAPTGSASSATAEGRDALGAPDGAVATDPMAGGKAVPGGADESGDAEVIAALPPGEGSGAGQFLLRTADLGLVVEGRDVTVVLDRVATLTASLDGYVLSSATGDPGVIYPEPAMFDEAAPADAGMPHVDPADSNVTRAVGSASLTVRVPERLFNAALQRFARLGRVEYRRTATQDVTSQMIDLRARLRHQRAVERRLLEFLTRSDTIREMLAVQDRLDAVQLQIEQLEAQIASLSETTTYSTITVFLRAEGVPAPTLDDESSAWGNFIDSWRLVGRGLRMTVLAAAALLPFGLVLGGIAAAALLGARRLAGRRRQTGDAPAA